MAVRLTVIMIETAPPTAGAGRLAEDIVGNVIGRPGIDLTLVRSLTGIESNSTDQLTLDSITGDCAVLDWQSPAEIVSALQQVGFNGQRAAHQRDPPAAAQSDAAAQPTVSRRIYAFDLHQFGNAEEVLEALEGLKSARQTKTFSIGTVAPVRSVPAAPDEPISHRSATPSARTTPSAPQTSSSAPPPPPPRTPTPTPTPTQSAPSSGTSAPPDEVGPTAELDLDDLIDQLDRSDT